MSIKKTEAAAGYIKIFGFKGKGEVMSWTDILLEGQEADSVSFIHSRHINILDAYLNDHKVRIKFNQGIGDCVLLCHHFIESYDPVFEYEIADIVKMKDGLGNSYNIDINDSNGKNTISLTNEEDISKESFARILKRLSGNKDEDMFIQCGFENPDFECEILNKTSDWLMGTVANYKAPCVWNEFGICLFQAVSDKSSNSKYDLTPIPKKWYELESNFPCLMFCLDKNDFMSCPDKETYLRWDLKGVYKLATNEEIDQLKIKE